MFRGEAVPGEIDRLALASPVLGPQTPVDARHLCARERGWRHLIANALEPARGLQHVERLALSERPANELADDVERAPGLVARFFEPAVERGHVDQAGDAASCASNRR